MAERAETRFSSGLLMLADISGYTAFLQSVTDEHPDLPGMHPVPPGYDFMITLLDLVADEMQPTFRPVQTEGDALFAVADADTVTHRGREVMETISSTYTSYHARIAEQRRVQAHECSACVHLASLELKFIVHAGSFVVHELSSRTHVAGPTVNLAHRLLKNRVTEMTGLRGYALFTDPALDLLGLDRSEGVAHSETYADAGTISGVIYDFASAASQTTA